jgi:predicted HAD superfamily phosphohydrolase YqeG
VIVCKTGTTVYFDIDDTIIMWSKEEITRPVKPPKGLDIVEVECNGFRSRVYYHIKHVKLVKQYAERGAVVILWSHGGSEWVKSVVTALGLEEYVFACLNKPTVYYDDLEAKDFMKNRRFVNLETGNDENC